MSSTSYQIANEIHLDLPWRVHSLLEDFNLADVWQIPVILEQHHSLKLFLVEGFNPQQSVTPHSLAWYLFHLRKIIGKAFKLDGILGTYHLFPGNLRTRYAMQEGISEKQLPDPGSLEFVPVYQLENEFLTEIQNKTVHAALHVGKVPLNADRYTVHLAVYVKPKGKLGELYLKIINPFRHWVVYPALLKGAGSRWKKFLMSQSG